MRLIAFDCETTGTDPDNDRIVSLALVELQDGGEDVPREQLFNPGMPIPPGATAVHGITDEAVKDAPPFAAKALGIQALLSKPDVVLIGFNNRSYDALILDAELRRAGQPGLPLHRLQEVDMLRAWKDDEPRTLAGMVRRYLGREPTDAHAALGDAVDAADLFRHFRDEKGQPVEAQIAVARPAGEVDRDGFFVREEGGRFVFGKGQHKGKPVTEEPGYLSWILENEGIRQHVKAVTRELAESLGIDVPRKLDPAGKFVAQGGRVRFTFGKHVGEPAEDHPDYLAWVIKGDFDEQTKQVARELLEGVA